jgi:hypothetical protein
MFTLKIFIVLLLSCNIGQSQQDVPQRVPRIVYESYPDAWYHQQAELWKAEIDKNPANPDAWYNYYNANRYASYVKTIDTKSKKDKLNSIIDDMGAAIPGTYEYHLLKYWNCFDVKNMFDLEKAHEIAPDRPDPYYGFISHHEINGNMDKVNEFYNKLYQSKDIAPWLINYNYNVLMSLEENAVLFTNGDNDTYPARMLQEVKGIRDDVTIINVSMSWLDTYVERKLSHIGISLDSDAFKKEVIPEDLKKPNTSPMPAYIPALCTLIHEKKPEIPVYFALTVYSNNYAEIQDDIYIVGLAYQYSPSRIDNIAILKKNVEKRFRLDYLRNNWYDEHYLGKRLRTRTHMNYFAIMSKLYEHYKAGGEEGKASEWKQFAIEIAREAGEQEAIEALSSDDQ